MRFYTLLASVLTALILLSGCAISRLEAVETPNATAGLYRFPTGSITPTPFPPQTYTPFPSPPASNLPPTPTPTIPTPEPTPAGPNWDEIGWPPPHFGAPGPTQVTPVPTPFPGLSPEETLNVLLIGSDRRSASAFRTDTLIVASIRPADRLVTLISFPRDLFVYIPGWRMQRINTAYLQGEIGRYPGGGPALLKDTFLYNFGLRIDHLALVEFDGFRSIIDTLDGVDTPLACPFTDWRIIDPTGDPEDEDNWELHTIGPGIVHMDGDLALWYARSRLKSSDFDRGRRQQELLRAIFKRSLQLNVIPRIPELYHQLRDTVDTDLTLNAILDLSPLALSLDGPRIRSYYITNGMVDHWRTPEGGAVLLPDGPAIHAMLQEAMATPASEAGQRMEIYVEIWNGTDNPNWEALAAERLHYAGFQTRISSPDRRDYEKSILFDFSAAQDPDQSSALLRSLGLPSSSLQAAPGAGSGAAYRLILGEDYNPCFNPSTLPR